MERNEIGQLFKLLSNAKGQMTDGIAKLKQDYLDYVLEMNSGISCEDCTSKQEEIQIDPNAILQQALSDLAECVVSSQNQKYAIAFQNLMAIAFHTKVDFTSPQA